MADVFRVGLEKLEAPQREYPTLLYGFLEWRALGAGES
jgi:hypothetical protein